MHNTEVIICTEPGKLEFYSRMLVGSIRLLDGAFSDVPIYSYSPRQNLEISQETLDFFKEYNVIHNNLKINIDFHDYPLANKPLVCAYHEKKSSAQNLIFCDSDTLFLNSPDIRFLGEFDLGIRPVDHKNIGVQEYTESPNGEYWNELHKIAGVKNPKFIKTTFGKEKIFSYFNTGLIFVKRSAGIFSHWESNFRKIYYSKIKPKNTFFIEQSCFAATVEGMGINIYLLPKQYNYPVGYNSVKWKGMYPFKVKDRIHLHYHSLFIKKKGDRLLKKMKNKLLIELLQKEVLNLQKSIQ